MARSFLIQSKKIIVTFCKFTGIARLDQLDTLKIKTDTTSMNNSTSKLNFLILLLVGFILYKGFNFNKKSQALKNKIANTSEKKKKASAESKPQTQMTTVAGSTDQTSSPQSENTPPQSEQAQRSDFDSLTDLNQNQHIEGIPVENAAIPVEKLTPAEMEQYQISLYEQKIVSETGTSQVPPVEKKEGEE